MKKQTGLTETSQSVLNAIASGKHKRDTIVTATSLSASAVGGAIRSLVNRGLIESTKDGMVATTPDAKQFITTRTRKPRADTKMAEARVLFQKHFKDGRPVVLSKLRDKVGLTEKGAITYYQNLRVEAGIAPQPLMQRRQRSSPLQKVASH